MKRLFISISVLFLLFVVGCQKMQVVEQQTNTDDAINYIQKNYQLIDDSFVQMGYVGSLYQAEDGTTFFIPKEKINTKMPPKPIECNQILNHQGTQFRCSGSGNQCRQLYANQIIVCTDALAIEDMF